MTGPLGAVFLQNDLSTDRRFFVFPAILLKETRDGALESFTLGKSGTLSKALVGVENLIRTAGDHQGSVHRIKESGHSVVLLVKLNSLFFRFFE